MIPWVTGSMLLTDTRTWMNFQGIILNVKVNPKKAASFIIPKEMVNIL
jgi:hypothetical protein